MARGLAFRTGLALLLAGALPAAAKVPEALRTPFAPLPAISRPATACPAAPEPQRFIEGVSFYSDPKFSRPDPKRLEADREVQRKFDVWLDAVQAAVDRRRAGERQAAACALTLLDSWAKAGAMGGAVNWQGSYHRVWALAGAGLAFLQVRDAEGLDQTAAGRVGRWMKEVAALIQPAFDRESRAAISDARNNQSAWAGLAVAVAGIAGGDRGMLDWGVARLRTQLSQVTPEGALPQELARGALALHYHLFALEPIAALERLATANNIALTPEEQAALERLTRFTLAAAQDPKRINALAKTAQNSFWLEGRPVLSGGAGLDIRAQAAPDAGLDAALQPFRPYRERWLGGLVTGIWTQKPAVPVASGAAPAAPAGSAVVGATTPSAPGSTAPTLGAAVPGATPDSGSGTTFGLGQPVVPGVTPGSGQPRGAGEVPPSGSAPGSGSASARPPVQGNNQPTAGAGAVGGAGAAASDPGAAGSNAARRATTGGPASGEGGSTPAPPAAAPTDEAPAAPTTDRPQPPAPGRSAGNATGAVAPSGPDGRAAAPTPPAADAPAAGSPPTPR